jgi:hypothetical protein
MVNWYTQRGKEFARQSREINPVSIHLSPLNNGYLMLQPGPEKIAKPGKFQPDQFRRNSMRKGFD